jgi:hypothetical protein
MKEGTLLDTDPNSIERTLGDYYEKLHANKS